MKKLFALCLSFFTHLLAHGGSLTLIVVSKPANTPANASIYVAGNFNNWTENNPNFQLTGTLIPSITIANVSGMQEFKFTRGSWAAVEGNANGGFLPNRIHNVVANDTLLITIQSWEDLAGSGGNSTAQSNVQILDNQFFIPQLNRHRRVWIYLPPDYELQPTKRYQVVYLQDGQNVFDAATSFSGEWGVDESLNLLFSQGDRGAIAVAVDNGGNQRLNEYSPWVHPQYGGGQGEAYASFLSETLKPFIDANYRTLTEPRFNAVMGSSMGGLISLYTGLQFQQQFGKLGIFSPALWFAADSLWNYMQNTNKQGPMRFYFVAGQNESASMVPHMQNARNILIGKGFDAQSEIRLLSHADGAHSEWYWRREFPGAYAWLFAGEEITTSLQSLSQSIPQFYPNPARHHFVIHHTGSNLLPVRIFAVSGSIVWQGEVAPGEHVVNTVNFAPGVYIVNAGNHTFKLLVQPY